MTIQETAAAMVAPGEGILAADESIGTMSSRLEKVGVTPSAEARRDYRELLVTTPELSRTVSGVILCEETLGQTFRDGRAFPRALADLGIFPGIKVDTGAKPLAGFPGETITEGLDNLAARFAAFGSAGARFAKWRAVIDIGDGLPTSYAIHANAHALARYAALAQAAGIVPIVEPEVMMTGDHTLERCAEVTTATLRAVFDELAEARIDRRGMVLKPNMVLAGRDCPVQPSVEEAAAATVAVLTACVPADVPGVAFLSGGQSPAQASAHLSAMQSQPTPWALTFSFGRALVDPALAAWHGDPALATAGQRALAARVACNAAALDGTYGPDVEARYAAA